MLRVDVMQAKPGMKLAMPVHHPKVPARMLLKAGFELTEAAIRSLADMAVRQIWVAYPALAGLEKFINPAALKVQQNVAAQITRTFENTQGTTTARLEYEHYRSSVTSMIEHIVTNPNTALFIGELSEAPSEMMRHASTVTFLSVLMGLKLESYLVRERKHINPVKAKEVVNLGVGAMLHDFGLTQLDPDILQRYQDHADENDPAYQEHPALGFRLLRGQIDPSAAACLLHHHQRFDGSGFAGQDFPAQSDHGIHVYARIVAVADQFDRMRRPTNLPEQPTVAVLHALLSDALRTKFDAEVVRALVEVVPPYAPGTPLRLSDGRAAVSLDHNVASPCRPLVQIIPELDALDQGGPDGETLDLAALPTNLYVAECEGKPVAEFNFPGSSVAAAA